VITAAAVVVMRTRIFSDDYAPRCDDTTSRFRKIPFRPADKQQQQQPPPPPPGPKSERWRARERKIRHKTRRCACVAFTRIRGRVSDPISVTNRVTNTRYYYHASTTVLTRDNILNCGGGNITTIASNSRRADANTGNGNNDRGRIIIFARNVIKMSLNIGYLFRVRQIVVRCNAHVVAGYNRRNDMINDIHSPQEKVDVNHKRKKPTNK